MKFTRTGLARWAGRKTVRAFGGGRKTATRVGRAFSQASKSKTIQRLAGRGAYRMRGRNITNGRSAYGAKFTHAGGTEKGAGICVSKTEYINVLTAGALGSGISAFVNSVLAVQPGVDTVWKGGSGLYARAGMFSWLPTVAKGFQKYRFKKCVLEYRPISSNSTATLAVGSVMMSTQYDNTQEAYVNKAQIMNSQWAISGTPSKKLFLNIECAGGVNGNKWLNVRQGNLNSQSTSGNYSDQQINDFDKCKINIASEGVPCGANTTIIIGEIYVHYEIEFSMYKDISAGAPAAAPGARSPGTMIMSTPGVFVPPTPARPMGNGTVGPTPLRTLWMPDGSDPDGVIVTPGTGSAFTVSGQSAQGARIAIQVMIGDDGTGTTPATVTDPVLTYGGCSALAFGAFSGLSTGYTNGGVATPLYINNQYIEVTDINGAWSVEYAATTYPAVSGTPKYNCSVQITGLPATQVGDGQD